MGIVAIKFRIKAARPGSGAFAVRLQIGNDTADGEFHWKPVPGTQEHDLVESIDVGDCTLETLKYPGAALWARLLEADKEDSKVATLFEIHRSLARKNKDDLLVRIDLPSELEHLPWEALYDETAKRFALLNKGFSIVREASGESVLRPLRPSAAQPLNVLVVIPERSKLDVEREWKNLDRAVSSLGDSIKLYRLEGRVHPSKLRQKLQEQEWDIVHFIGHGETSGGIVTIRLNTEGGDDFDMSAETFADLFNDRGVQLVVLNCCYGGAVGSLGGIGPFLRARGVPAVVAMRFEIPDHVANFFSDSFYRELVSGKDAGRVDAAVHAARETIYFNHKDSDVRGFITPALFLGEGSEQLFEVSEAVTVAVQVAPAPAPPPASRLVLPQDLVRALKTNRCVPVIGSGILRAGLSRSAAPTVPDLRELSRRIAANPQYPGDDDFRLCEVAGEWMDTHLLQWVCQNYVVGEKKKRYELIDLINEAYDKSAASAQLTSLLASIASWRVPGFFYTFFDGLFERTVREYRDRPTGVLSGVNLDPQEQNERLLVLVRGTRDEPKSLVLTEDDHDKLWDRMAKMNSRIADLARGYSGRSLLFLGLTPRDPLVRRLSAKLLDAGDGDNRTQGPTFFACSTHTRIDDAYWRKFDVQWIDDPLELLIPALTEASS